MSRKAIVLDDSDPRIRYVGQGWFQDMGSQDEFGTYGQTYNRTSHGTKSNDSLVFSFEGTSVKLFGTTNLVDTNSTRYDPKWECFVDKVSIGATEPFAYHENNWLLCETSNLPVGAHEFTLNISTGGTTFWVDYLHYTPSPSTSDTSTIVVVENNDSAIVYDSSWQSLAGLANATSTQGSQVTFNFTGSKLTWYGYVPVELPHNASSGTYTIDGGSPTSFALHGLAPYDGTSTYNQIFFTTPDLPEGAHSLHVTYDGNSQLTPLTLDYIYLTTRSPQATSNSTSLPPHLTSSSTHHSPVGAIVGGTIAGVAVILLGLVAFVWWRRKRKTTHATVEPRDAPQLVAPFSGAASQPSSVQPSSPLTPPLFAPTRSTNSSRTFTSASGFVSGISALSPTMKQREAPAASMPAPSASQNQPPDDSLEDMSRNENPPRYSAS
ncbi:hypothetical protein Hypma_005450 [Hypsizygus marmoreus]|uniref:Transmembrane protein n=1 Tax=Hypsizygus marmoreus TaxID=39966 RepID=A0A369J5T1_HYPMA|nr:hypothetical protein Hypma_005450 [Hypsizygus marmoreus]